MEAAGPFQLYAWAAVLSAAATLLTFITGLLFFSLKKSSGKLNDISSIFQVIFMLPLIVLFVQLLPGELYILSLFSALLGIIGILLSATGQTLLVLERIDFQSSLKFFPAGAAIGIWLMLTCSLAARSHLLPPPIVWLGILAGAGYVLTVIGFLRNGQKDRIFLIGGVLTGVIYPIWATWLGWLLISG